jgi:hypothetical protein
MLTNDLIGLNNSMMKIDKSWQKKIQQKKITTK